MKIPKNEESNVVKETPSSFYKKIDKIVKRDKVRYLEAVIDYMQKHEYEPEYVAKLCGAVLKNKIEEEGMVLNLVKKENKLEFDDD